MKAAIVREPGLAPEFGDFAEPVVGDGQELVELVATGIHPIVRGLAAGAHYGSSGAWPMIPGIDAVARTADGTLVYTGYVAPPYGTLAQRMAVPAAIRMPLPDGADPAAVAGGINPGMSSWMPMSAHLAERGSLGTVLILGVTGMAGLLAVQNAKILGAAAVIGAGRSPERLAQAENHGARTVNLDGGAPALADALDGRAPDLVLDYLWGTAAEAAFEALGRKGLGEDSANISYVEVGSAAGPTAALPSSLLRSRRIRLAGSGAGSAQIATIVDQLPTYLRHMAAGKLTVPTQSFPLSRVADAWVAAEGARAVVVPD